MPPKARKPATKKKSTAKKPVGAWITFVKKVWTEMKSTNKSASYKDAMVEASRRYKK